MQNNIIEEIARSLSITFMHSLWQGFILLAVARVTLLMAADQSSAIRYRILTGYFVVFILATGFTFLSVFGQGDNSGQQTILPFTEFNNLLDNSSTQISFLRSVSSWCSDNALGITGIWSAIFLIKCILFTRSISDLYKIKKYHAPRVGSAWNKKLAELSLRIKLSRIIEFRESGKISQPFVFGLFKPVLLVPMGMLAQLAPGEVEAVLLHELAHIKRQDLLVNFLQVCIGTIFFFNPFVYWLSGMIRLEREYCCDDVCLQKSGNKKALISALISFHENSGFLLNHKLPLLGNKNLLSGRVHHIINGKCRNVSWYGAWLLPLCFTALAFVLLSFNKMHNIANDYPLIVKEKNKKEERPGQTGMPAGVFISHPLDTTHPKRKPARSANLPGAKDKLPVPGNATAEFIAGYQAGMNYAKGKVPEGEKATREMKEIEENRGQQSIIKPPPKISPSVPKADLSKLEIEMKLHKKGAG